MVRTPRGEDDALLLLALCARPRLPPDTRDEIGARAARVQDWIGLLALAEKHGLGPLLYLSSHAERPPPGSSGTSTVGAVRAVSTPLRQPRPAFTVATPRW